MDGMRSETFDQSNGKKGRRGRGSHAASRAHVGRPVGAEREQLRASLGALLAAERVAAGYSQCQLARAIGCARSTIERLELGERRPRECLLRYLASVLAVDDPRPLAERLIAAAGEACRPDTAAAVRHRRRRADAALLAGWMPLPARIAQPLALHRQADAARACAHRLFDAPGALGDTATLAEINRLMAEARYLRALAGPPIVIVVGGRRIAAGWS